MPNDTTTKNERHDAIESRDELEPDTSRISIIDGQIMGLTEEEKRSIIAHRHDTSLMFITDAIMHGWDIVVDRKSRWVEAFSSVFTCDIDEVMKLLPEDLRKNAKIVDGNPFWMDDLTAKDLSREFDSSLLAEILLEAEQKLAQQEARKNITDHDT